MNERVHVMRQAVVKLTNMLAGRGIEVTQRGITAYVRSDEHGRPLVVNLPYLPDNATDELIDAIQGFLDHEVGHILFTDFSLMAKANELGVGNMLNLLEDTREERCMAERFPGSAYNLARTGRFFLDKYTTPKINEAIAKGDEQLLVGVLTVPLIRAMAGQQVFKDFMADHMGAVADLYDKIKDLEPRIQAMGSTKDALDLAVEVVKRIRDGEEEETVGPGKGKPRKGGKGGKGKAGGKKKGAEKGAAAGEEEEKEGGAAGEEEEDDSTGSGPGEEGDEEDEGDLRAGEEGDEDDDDDAPGKAAKGKPPAEGEIDIKKRAPLSWDKIDKETANDFDASVSKAICDATAEVSADADYIVYTKDKDVIEPLHIGHGYRDEMLKSLQDETDHLVGPIQKDLERAIAARSLSQWHPGLRSGRLHAANLNRLVVPLPGGMVDDRVFRRKHETTSKDVAVELVVDISGSMRGSKVHTAAKAAYALASTLERIGIACEVICFTTGEAACRDYAELHAAEAKIGKPYSRSESLYMPILKGFQERMSTEVKKRFGWMPNSSGMSQNVDGECVEIAAMRLLTRRERGKVMLVLSDGQPAASGNSHELRSHLKRVVQNISKRGVQIVGIGIESDAVRHYYPKALVLHNVAELPSTVVKELRHLIVH